MPISKSPALYLSNKTKLRDTATLLLEEPPPPSARYQMNSTAVHKGKVTQK